MVKLAVLVYNPSAKTAAEPEHWLGPIVHRLCEQSNFMVITVPKRSKESYKDLIPLLKPPVELVIAAGGDGTVRSVLAALAESKADIPAAIVPLGTWNMLARCLGIMPDGMFENRLEKALSTIIDGRTMKMDIGLMNDEYFALSAGVGPVAEAFVKPNRPEKTYLKRFAYYKELLLTYFSAPVSFEVTADGCTFKTTATGILVSNVPDFGIASHTHASELNDGKFFLSIVAPKNTFDYLKLVGRYLLGLNLGKDLIPMKKVNSVSIEVLPQPSLMSKFQRYCLGLASWLRGKNFVSSPTIHSVLTMIDGEESGKTPMHVSLVPSAIKILVPAEFADKEESANLVGEDSQLCPKA